MTWRRGLAAAGAVAGVMALWWLGAVAAGEAQGAAAPEVRGIRGWLSWRGPQQNGTSLETHLPDAWEPGKNDLWTYDLPGRGTPVIAGGRLYTLGYDGEGPDLREVLVCLDAATGKKLWDRRFNDFLSDIVYSRYSIGSPAVDAETGNVYFLTSAGLAGCCTAAGQPVWQHSLMEEFGRLTFPNGRTGAPAIDDDLVIVRGITSNWGTQGPGADRFYAFDKKTGQLAWSSTPGQIPPKDSSFSMPVFAWWQGKRVFYCGTGDGSIVCVNARTGEPIWRYVASAGGINASVVLAGGNVIVGHADENLDSSEIGRMVAVKVDAALAAGPGPGAGAVASVSKGTGGAAASTAAMPGGPAILGKSAEAWRNSVVVLTSSPVVVGERLYQVSKTGDLCAIDAQTGKVYWTFKLGPDQLHASPLYADGKLYIPVRDAGFYIIKPTDTGAQVLSHFPLDGEALGAPAAWNGKVYVQTTKRLYCFGSAGDSAYLPTEPAAAPRPTPGPATQIQVVPAEVTLRPGRSATFALHALDANGLFVRDLPANEPKWQHFVPPTAKVRAAMDAEFNERGELAAKPDAQLSAGSWEVTANGLKGTMRGRVLPDLPYRPDFQGVALSEDHATEKDAAGNAVQFAYPPLPWIGARFKWELRTAPDDPSRKVLTKTIDNIFFQRAYTFIGPADLHDYTVEADVMAEGNRRNMPIVGVINQRYTISLVGNWQQLEVVSNQERIKVGVPFKWQPMTWYRLKSRVDVASDGSGVIRAKAWKRGDPEPAAWTIEVPHHHAHEAGAPGIYGFALQSQFRVFVDNIAVTANR